MGKIMKIKFLAIMFALVGLTACEAPAPIGTEAANGDSTISVPRGADSSSEALNGGEIAPGVWNTVNFDYDSAAIRADAATILNKQAAYLKGNSSAVLIEGHCDERGTREYNLALGERRANSVKQYLASQGVDAGRIETISYGKERPVAVGSDEGSWAKNRRGVTIVK